MGRIYTGAASIQVWLDTIELVTPFLGQLIDISDGRNIECFVATLMSKTSEWRFLTTNPGSLAPSELPQFFFVFWMFPLVASHVGAPRSHTGHDSGAPLGI